MSTESDGTQTTLVTGFPRQVSRMITAELLASRPGGRVALLARARHLDDARRFAARQEDPSRVEVIEGDVTAIDLGLGGAEYTALARRTREVHHAAVSATETSDPRAAQHLNVQGAREVLAFSRESAARAGAAPRVVHYSSVAVAGGAVPRLREAPMESSRAHRDPVTASLRRAEAMFVRAWPELPSTVARVSTMVGHSRTGEVDLLEGVYLLVLLMMSAPREITVPLPLRDDTTLNLVPVDFVARAGVALGADPRAARRVVHLVDPAPQTARRALELLAAAVARRAPRGMVPVNITRALLRTPGVERLVKSPRAFAERIAGRVHYEGDGAHALLAERSLRCPPFETYVDAMVDHVRDRLARSPVHADAPPEPDDDPLL